MCQFSVNPISSTFVHVDNDCNVHAALAVSQFIVDSITEASGCFDKDVDVYIAVT